MLNKFHVLVLSINKNNRNSEEITRHDDYNSVENKFLTSASIQTIFTVNSNNTGTATIKIDGVNKVSESFLPGTKTYTYTV